MLRDLIKRWAKMGREVLEKNMSTLSGARRKKNFNRFWVAEYSKKLLILSGSN